MPLLRPQHDKVYFLDLVCLLDAFNEHIFGFVAQVSEVFHNLDNFKPRETKRDLPQDFFG